jgi:hypothetical protein
MPAVEVAVPVDILSSEPLVLVRTLPPGMPYTLKAKGGENLFSLNRATGALHLHDNTRERIAQYTGKKFTLYLEHNAITY